MARLLIEAISNGEQALALEIIRQGIFGCIDSQTSRRDGTALFFCCSRGFYDLAKILLEMGASVSSTDKSLATPLHAAVDNGHLNIVKLLLIHGANVDSQTSRGDTPIHLSAYRGYEEITHCLVEAGANILVANARNQTPQREAFSQGHYNISNYLKNLHYTLYPDMSMSYFSDSMIQLDPPSDIFEQPEEKRHPKQQTSSLDSNSTTASISPHLTSAPKACAPKVHLPSLSTSTVSFPSLPSVSPSSVSPSSVSPSTKCNKDKDENLEKVNPPPFAKTRSKSDLKLKDLELITLEPPVDCLLLSPEPRPKQEPQSRIQRTVSQQHPRPTPQASQRHLSCGSFMPHDCSLPVTSCLYSPNSENGTFDEIFSIGQTKNSTQRIENSKLDSFRIYSPPPMEDDIYFPPFIDSKVTPLSRVYRVCSPPIKSPKIILSQLAVCRDIPNSKSPTSLHNSSRVSEEFSDIYDSSMFSISSLDSLPGADQVQLEPQHGDKVNTQFKLQRTISDNEARFPPSCLAKRPALNKSVSVDVRSPLSHQQLFVQQQPYVHEQPFVHEQLFSLCGPPSCQSNNLSSNLLSLSSSKPASMTCVNIPIN